MNQDQFDDLKQFIDARLSQTEAVLRGEFDQKLGRIETAMHRLRQEMRDGFAGVLLSLLWTRLWVSSVKGNSQFYIC